jgi:hypothetical protein
LNLLPIPKMMPVHVLTLQNNWDKPTKSLQALYTRRA